MFQISVLVSPLNTIVPLKVSRYKGPGENLARDLSKESGLNPLDGSLRFTPGQIAISADIAELKWTASADIAELKWTGHMIDIYLSTKCSRVNDDSGAFCSSFMIQSHNTHT